MEVEVVRALRRFDEQSFVVKLPEGLQIAVPAWMLDPVHCGQLQQRDRPSIALKAVLELAQLIEMHRLPSPVINSESAVIGSGVASLLLTNPLCSLFEFIEELLLLQFLD
jgi:hypothetical protein